MKPFDYSFEVHKLVKSQNLTISCVITAYNEEKDIHKVLEVIQDFPLFNEIIVVNDGSKDKTLEIINSFKKSCPNLQVIDQQPNKGKTKGIVAGVARSKSELVCLLDADLTGLKFEYIYKMIYYVINHEFSMTILDRAGDRQAIIGPTQSWIARFNGGERAFWKKDFDQIVFPEDSRYALEQLINLYYVKHQLKVRTIYCSDLYGAYKYDKRGLLTGLKEYHKMFSEIYKHAKVKDFYIQVENIVEDRIEPLYKLSEKTNKNKTIVGAILVTGLVTSIATFAWLRLRSLSRKKEQ
jgi:glycosyltransferase involved in cell wall biosynthesis